MRRALREAFPAMFGARWEEACAIFYRRFDAIHLERLAVCEGAEALIAALAERGVHLSVVSNKMGKNLRREAGHLGWERYFSRLVGASDATRDKPATEPVDLALSGAGVKRGADVWFVGDTSVDLECARKAGLHRDPGAADAASQRRIRGVSATGVFASCRALREHVESL